MSSNDEIVQQTQRYLIENYGRMPLAVARAAGARFWDADGKEYLDFFAGFGGAGVAGHCHPKVVEAIQQQAGTVLAHGNLHTSRPQVELARAIVEHGFGGKVFFCHSGAEANEAALKLVRKAAGAGRYKILSFDGCFHGRTMGALSLTPEPFQKGFEPMLGGNVKVPYDDLDAAAAAIDGETAGVFVEALQGEGGINHPSHEFMQGLRKLCDENGVLLVVDEVWTAPARTGQWYAYQHYGIEPDAMTLGKACGGGAPVAALVAAPKWADVLGPGTHGCTLGGNPLCAAAGAATFALIQHEGLVARAAEKGREIVEQIRQAHAACVREVRGLGFMLGLQLSEDRPAKDVMQACLDRGLWVCVAKNNVLRLAPALVTSDEDLQAGLDILLSVLNA
mgnify:CR=1 FL=1